MEDLSRREFLAIDGPQGKSDKWPERDRDSQPQFFAEANSARGGEFIHRLRLSLRRNEN